jgi:tetratricopeptide (TPR) repeat protein
MKIFRRLLLFAASASILSALALHGLTQTSPATQRTTAGREEAYRANNLGVALLEQYKYKEGAESFTHALQLDPKLAIARINLSIALFNVPDAAGAQREAEKAVALNPNAPQPHYILGLIAKAQNRNEDAIAAFQRVLKLDPRDVGANVNIGQLYASARNYTEAASAFRVALEVDPYNMTALYNLGLALTRSNQRAEGQQAIQRFQDLRQRGTGTTIGQNYLEQGHYSEAIASTGAEPELVDRAVPAVTFVDATASMLPAKASAPGSEPPVGHRSKVGELSDVAAREEIAAEIGGAATLFDYDNDGDLDLLRVSPSGQRLYRNDGGKFVDVTEQSGALAAKPAGIGTSAVAGDYDNDGKPDLFVMRYGSATLYHNDGGGKFSDATTAAAIPSYPYLSSALAFVDVDHDGDLDIFIGGLADLSKMPKATDSYSYLKDFPGAPNMLLRNDGNGKFTDITQAAKVGGTGGRAMAVVPTDYDNHRDIDLLVVNYGQAPDLYSNQRDGSFRNVAREVGLDVGGNWTAVAAGDVNKDGFTDFFFTSADGPGLFAISDGQGKFKTTQAPAGSGVANAAQFIDYDNDGLLDLLLLSNGSVRVWRNLGDGWMNTSERAMARELTATAQDRIDDSSHVMASGDLDGDGDTDLIVRSNSGGLKIARNDGGNLNRSLRVNLLGRVSNRSAIGAKIEVRAGSLGQKLETYSAYPAPAPSDVVFGLGTRARADAVRVLWPAGIVQAEMEAASATDPKKTTTTLPITELDKKPSSCPFLYTWNGERFEFITDFMGGGEMGYQESPGHFNTPDPDEYVRIRADQLKERNGRYEIRMTNELEEVLYVDRVQLLAVAHPVGVEVYPNEGMKDPPRPFILYKTRNAHPPLAATDDHGHDVLSRLTKVDRQFADDFPLERIRGYAGEHTLTLKLDDEKQRSGRYLLLLTGWTDYAFSSDNVAASHAGLETKLPALQVKDARGRWQTIIEDIGIPVGRPQTVTVDLTGKFLSSSREVRIVTSLRIYWDQILVDTSTGSAPVSMTRLDPVTADLHWRGYSSEVTPDGREPFGYDYEKVSDTAPWKVFPGHYTRIGDVRELLQTSDDQFVISRTGDEMSLSFDASLLPKLPAGWTRTFLLYADGFSKEMDINSASPDQVMPLPYHGMKRYPYSSMDAYPMTKARRAYMEKYNTRIVASPLPLIETMFANDINKPQMNTDGRR